MDKSLKELIQDKKSIFINNVTKDETEYKNVLESFLIKTIELFPKDTLQIEVFFDYQRIDQGEVIYINGQEQNQSYILLFNAINDKKQFLSLPHKLHSISNDSPYKDLLLIEKLTKNSLLFTLL